MNIVRWHDDFRPEITWFMLELDSPEKEYSNLELVINGTVCKLPRSYSEQRHTLPVYRMLADVEVYRVQARATIDGNTSEATVAFSLPTARPKDLPEVDFHVGAQVYTPSEYCDGRPSIVTSSVRSGVE